MLAEVWLTTVQTLKPLIASVEKSNNRIQLTTGGVVDMWSLTNVDSVRGRKYQRVVIDEAAMVPGLGNAWQAVIRPTLSDYRGDAWMLSTPRGRNFFWECFQRGQAADDGGEWCSWQMPTSTNPYIHPDELAAAKAELPELVFSQEYLAQFLEDSGGVFRRVLDAVRAVPQDEAQSEHEYVMGVDWGRQNDYTVLTVVDVTTREVAAIDRFNQVDYALQLGRLRGLVERFRPSVIVAEENSIGLPLVEQMQRQDMPVQPFKTTNSSKANIIDALALAFERGEIGLVDDPALLAELQAFEMSRLPSGLTRYAAPEGMHDDMVMALALAWHAVGQGGPLVLW
jgi:hypothetical protein